MASLCLRRVSLASRLSSSLFTRSYAAYIPRTYSKPTAVPVAKASTAASTTSTAKGQPEVIDELPATPAEINIPTFDAPPTESLSEGQSSSTTDWSKSYHGLSSKAFSNEAAKILMAPIDPLDIEVKPDGLLYLPEIKYRRILNKAFGPGGWGLAPRSETNVGPKIVSREYALVCEGRLVGIARGEQEYFDPSGIPTATEACKSNALMRCCKDLGVASELWDPRFIREFKAKYCTEVFAENVVTKKKKKLWRRKDTPKFTYPFVE